MEKSLRGYLIIFLIFFFWAISISYAQVTEETDWNWKIYENIFSKGEEEKEEELKEKIKVKIEDNILLRDYLREEYEEKEEEEKEREVLKEKEKIYTLPPYSKGKVIVEEEIEYKKGLAPPEYPEYIYEPKRIVRRPTWRELPLEERPRFLHYIAKSYSPILGGGIGYLFFNPKDIEDTIKFWREETYSYLSSIENEYVTPIDKEGNEIEEKKQNKYAGVRKGELVKPLGSFFYYTNISFMTKKNLFLEFCFGKIYYLGVGSVEYDTIRDLRDIFTDEDKDEKDDDPDDKEVYDAYRGNFSSELSIQVDSYPLAFNIYYKYPYGQFRDMHLYTGLGFMILPTKLMVDSVNKSNGIVVTDGIIHNLNYFKIGYGITFFQGFRLDFTEWLSLNGALNFRLASASKFNPRRIWCKRGSEKIWYFNPDTFRVSFTGFGFNFGLNILF